jgi:hypothetical protein
VNSISIIINQLGPEWKELQRHARELTANPAEWMPWNYRQTLESPGV